MTDARGLHSKALRGLLVPLLAVTLTASCTSAENGAKEENPSDRRFDALMSAQNDLYFHPFLRAEPATPEVQSYALRTLQLLGKQPQVSISDKAAREFHKSAVDTSTLWGRYWLTPVGEAGAKVLDRRDVRAIAKSRKKGGWYVDSVLGDESVSARIGGTWAALETLKELDAVRTIPAGGRETTVRWLNQVAENSRDLAETAALARMFRLLDEPVPEKLAATRPPDAKGLEKSTADRRAQLLEDTYHYVLLRQSAGKRVTLDRRTWERVLASSLDDLDHERLHSLVVILDAAGAKQRVLEPVAKRLERDQGADGLLRDPSSYVGSLDASYFVQRLRQLADTGTRDKKLYDALDDIAEQDYFSGHGAEQLTWLALRATSGDDPPDTEETKALCTDPEIVPTQVTRSNAAQWQRMADICAQLGTRVSEPRVKRWSLDTPEGAVAASALVIGMADAVEEDAVAEVGESAEEAEGATPVPGRAPSRSRAVSWITPDALAVWTGQLRLSSVYERALVARAHLLRGGTPTDAETKALRANLTSLRGCPQLPDLSRMGDKSQTCDLRTTWAVWSLDQQRGGDLGVLPGTSDARTNGDAGTATQRRK